MNPLYMTLGIGLGMLVAGAVPPEEAGTAVAEVVLHQGAIPATATIVATLAPDGGTAPERRSR